MVHHSGGRLMGYLPWSHLSGLKGKRREKGRLGLKPFREWHQRMTLSHSNGNSNTNNNIKGSCPHSFF